MLALYDGWHPAVTGLMAVAPTAHLIKWALFDRPPLPGWQRGQATLLGDAAHPMLPRTTAERLLMTLLTEGYVERDPDTKAFFVTAQVHALSNGYAEQNQLVTSARPVMPEMTRQIGWPLCLAMPMGEYMSVRVTTDPETTLNLNRRHIGSAGAMGMVSSGLAFLAFLDETQKNIMLEMLRRSDNPAQAAVRDTQRMDYLLEKVRSDGYSFGLDSGRERSVSVPIMANGRVRGALLMVFFASVLSHEVVVDKFLPRIKALAREIEENAFGPAS